MNSGDGETPGREEAPVKAAPTGGDGSLPPSASPETANHQREPVATELLLPTGESSVSPELSIVIPALNEEIAIGQFVDWCREGLARAQVAGEILIVDSSTDRTAEIALAKGARVLRTPKRGLGNAYRDAIPFIRGRYILMGDADCTYDFRELAPFVESFRAGQVFIMGSRFRGSIEPDAMPALHQYFGTPLTTWILNRIYGSSYTDIHCGMRGITREALVRMRLRSTSWEYASEMVLKAVQMKLPTAEVPVRFLKDMTGRLSHHRREGWLSPWKAGWINLQSMLVNGGEFFALRPGFVLFALGLALTIPFSFGRLTVGPITFSIYWMLLGMTLTIVGQQSIYMGVVAQVIHDYTGEARRSWKSLFSYDRSVGLSVIVGVVGFLLILPMVREYWQLGFRLPETIGFVHHIAITGLLGIIMGFLHFNFTLVLHTVCQLLEAGEHDGSR